MEMTDAMFQVRRQDSLPRSSLRAEKQFAKLAGYFWQPVLWFGLLFSVVPRNS